MSDLIKPRDYRWYGCRRDVSDARDREFKPKATRIPKAYDLRAHCPPVMDQGEVGSCTAHAITAALRYLLLKSGKPDIPLARLQLYYDERKIEGTTSEDAGAEIRNGIKCAVKLGVAHEALWPYDIARFKDAPNAPVYADALKFHAVTYERVAVITSAIKAAIYSGFPVVIGVSLYDSFEGDAVEKTGNVPMPNLKTEQLVGGHCMLTVGYGQRTGMFTVQNSWNTDWADKGFCYLPEAYLGSPKFGSDYWIIKSVGSPS